MYIYIYTLYIYHITPNIMNSEKPENIKTSIDIHEPAWILAKSWVPRSVDSVDLMGAGQHWVSQTGTVYFDIMHKLDQYVGPVLVSSLLTIFD